ncbi:MAG: PaaX family transcriptional regulator C-terminal domain-containing protein [Patescibacteria group bacterium]
MNLRRTILLAAGLFEYFLNHYDEGFEDLYHPGRYLYSSFESLTDRRTLRKNISSLVSAGWLKKRDKDYYNLTPLGWSKLDRVYPLNNSVQKKWDGLWRIVVYDISEAKRKERDLLRRHLKGLGFRLWQKSTWITPRDVSQELYDLLKDNKITGRISVFESRNLFGLSDQKLTDHVWPMNTLAKEYRQLISDWNSGKREAGTDRFKVREIAREVQAKYWQLINKDPYLPVELLPEKWPGKALKTALSEMFQALSV